MHYQLNTQEHLSGLNDQQRDAVLSRSPIVYVTAGPGTGKTHMLTSKLVDYIVSSETPQKIVALSYTNTAARQIGERFRKKAASLGRHYSFYNGTIHSFCFRMLNTFYPSFGYTILDDEELTELASDISQSLRDDTPVPVILSCLRSDSRMEGSRIKNTVSALKESLKVISVQDILTLFISRIDSDPDFREWLSSQVTVMAVDEAQDLSVLNYTILDKMIGINPSLQVFLVGDPRQNIFEFNGGSYKNLERFLSRHPSHETKTLSITYRCCRPVSDFVNSFEFSDCRNFPLQALSDEGKLSVLEAYTESDEADRVYETIMESGDISSCAVLSNNLKYLEPLIRILRRESVPYKVFGGVRRVKRHIRFLNHVLRVIENGNAYSIRKIAQYAGIDITVNGKRSRNRFFESELGKIIQSISEDSQGGSSFTRIASRVIDEIMRDPSDDGDTSSDYGTFLSLTRDYATVSEYLASFATDREKFISFYTAGYEECEVPTDKGYLTLSTIHSAKGLEWDTVFIMGLCEGNFPNPYFCKSLPENQQEEFFNNEWKKMYVASTRARKTLCLTYPKTILRKGYTFRKDPSRFIASCRAS